MALSPAMSTAAAERGYPDLHDHIDALRQAGLLIEIDREINKDTEMHPLVRWQFRGGIAPESGFDVGLIFPRGRLEPTKIVPRRNVTPPSKCALANPPLPLKR